MVGLASRLAESKRAAAHRGELRVPLPVGFVYDEGEADILDSVIEFVCGELNGTDGTDGPTPDDDDTTSADDELSSRETEVGSLAYQLAWSVARSRQPTSWRLTRLGTLGTDGPAAALPATLAAAGTILRTTATGDRRPAHPE